MQGLKPTRAEFSKSHWIHTGGVETVWNLKNRIRRNLCKGRIQKAKWRSSVPRTNSSLLEWPVRRISATLRPNSRRLLSLGILKRQVRCFLTGDIYFSYPNDTSSILNRCSIDPRRSSLWAVYWPQAFSPKLWVSVHGVFVATSWDLKMLNGPKDLPLNHLWYIQWVTGSEGCRSGPIMSPLAHRWCWERVYWEHSDPSHIRSGKARYKDQIFNSYTRFGKSMGIKMAH